MPRLRRLSGDETIAIFTQFGFRVHRQSGSHVKLRRTTESGAVQNLTVTRHLHLDLGLCGLS